MKDGTLGYAAFFAKAASFYLVPLTKNPFDVTEITLLKKNILMRRASLLRSLKIVGELLNSNPDTKPRFF